MTTSFDMALMSAWYDKKMTEKLIYAGDTVSWNALGNATTIATEVSKEVEMLPKDLLSELEKLDEKRVNEHLNRIDGSMGQDYGRSLGLDLNDIARMQRMQNDLMNSQLQQSRQMFASSQQIQLSRGITDNWNR